MSELNKTPSHLYSAEQLVPGLNLTESYISTVESVLNEYQTLNPGFVGFNAFGSLARGEAQVKMDGSCSDIDGSVIIDADLQPSIREVLMNKPDGIGVFPFSDTGLGMNTRVDLRTRIMDAAGAQSAPDLDLVVVSKELSGDVPRQLLKSAEEPTEDVVDWSTVDEPIKEFLRYMGSRDFIVPLFYKDVYGKASVSKYRNMVLDSLTELQSQKPQITERAWTVIKTYVKHFEKGRDDSPMRYIPETLAEAVEFYK